MHDEKKEPEIYVCCLINILTHAEGNCYFICFSKRGYWRKISLRHFRPIRTKSGKSEMYSYAFSGRWLVQMIVKEKLKRFQSSRWESNLGSLLSWPKAQTSELRTFDRRCGVHRFILRSVFWLKYSHLVFFRCRFQTDETSPVFWDPLNPEDYCYDILSKSLTRKTTVAN